ncbi:MAG: cytochrome b/b6 domain-containing protein [Magnetococcales bacterium]|nr:cytochrome b/b6 domain-containing protein [Magnetococcales bacterium]
MKRVFIYSSFERFWHWTQAALIVMLMLSGFEIHGSYVLWGFEKSVQLHRYLAWGLIILWAFAIFWHFTTGNWRQYIPTTQKLAEVAIYYTKGIFEHLPHPYKLTKLRKHNPLQRLAYLFFKLIISPATWISGLLYMYFSEWTAWGLAGYLSLFWVAGIHTAAAFLMMAFFCGHVYMAFVCSPITAHIRAMITGYEEVEDDE